MAKPNKQIQDGKKEIKLVMQDNLASISESIIKQIVTNYNKAIPSQRINAIKNITPKNTNQYKSDLKATLAVISSLALDQARLEVPAAKKVKLMENEERLLFGEFEELPPDIRKRINTSNQLLIGTQIADLEKNIFFNYISSLGSDKPISEIEFDMNESANKYITGQTINAGAGVTAANIVNESRNAFFYTDDVLEEIEAFEFMNSSPVAPICVDLVGTIFAKDDPNKFRYTPPLHYNCESWIRPILKLRKSQSITRLEPSSKKSRESVQFAGYGCQCSKHIKL